VFTHEAVRDWEARLAPLLCSGARRPENGVLPYPDKGFSRD
jgi:hypothetical protein